MYMRSVLLSLAVVSGVWKASAAESDGKRDSDAVRQLREARPKRERSEWCRMWWSNAPDAKRARVLLIGDSIAVGYHGVVSEQLKGKANVDLLATSKSIADPALAKETQLVMEGYGHAVIHFNNGLHGWHVTDAEYRTHLEAWVKLLRRLAPDATLVWASSTPITVRGKTDKLSPKDAKVRARNTVAAEVMQANGIATDDLYSLVKGKAALRSTDGYHYQQKGRTVQGKAVADAVLKVLKGQATR